MREISNEIFKEKKNADKIKTKIKISLETQQKKGKIIDKNSFEIRRVSKEKSKIDNELSKMKVVPKKNAEEENDSKEFKMNKDIFVSELKKYQIEYANVCNEKNNQITQLTKQLNMLTKVSLIR